MPVIDGSPETLSDANSNATRADQPTSSPIGLVAATATVIASMIGVGIFESPGYTLASLGSGRMAFLAWLVGAQIAICGAVAYAALASRLTESGGEYLYLSRRVHPWAGFVAGWTSLFAGFAGPTAAAALAIERCLPIELKLEGAVVPVTVVVTAAVLQAFGLRLAGWSQAVLVGTKVLFLAGAGGVLTWYAIRSQTIPDDALTIAFPSAVLGEFATSLMWISFSYTGFNAAIYFAGSVKDPAKTVPRSLILGTCATAALYLSLVGALYATAEIWADLFADPQPFRSAAMEIDGLRGRRIVDCLVTLCLMTSVWSLLMTGPHVTSRMASDGYFPSVLAAAPGRVPYLALGLQTAIAVVIVVSTSLQTLMTHLGMTLSLCSAASVATLLKSGQRISGGCYMAAWVYVLASLTFAGIATWHKPANALGTIAILASASAAYAILKPRTASQK